jgi:hypothetical protein
MMTNLENETLLSLNEKIVNLLDEMIKLKLELAKNEDVMYKLISKTDELILKLE